MVPVSVEPALHCPSLVVCRSERADPGRAPFTIWLCSGCGGGGGGGGSVPRATASFRAIRHDVPMLCHSLPCVQKVRILVFVWHQRFLVDFAMVAFSVVTKFTVSTGKRSEPPRGMPLVTRSILECKFLSKTAHPYRPYCAGRIVCIHRDHPSPVRSSGSCRPGTFHRRRTCLVDPHSSPRFLRRTHCSSNAALLRQH
jgi:hypothetical protein